MFRRLAGSLPEDPSWEADLIKLGYFINDKSQIRQIRKPTERFQFKVTGNDRFNEVHKEAFHKCLRKEIASRMQQLGAPLLYLPQLTTVKPTEPSVPIFATRQELLKTKKSVIVTVNDHMQDLGIWAYRKICDDSFDAGSCTGTVKVIKLRHHSTENEPGIVILNPGQYYYSHKEGRSLSHESWEALPRKSLFHPTIRADETHNLVPGSRDKAEHIATVFDKVILNREYVSKDADLYLIGICGGGNTLVSYLDKHWSTLSTRVKATAWVHPHFQPQTLQPSLSQFIEMRARSWVLSSAPLGTCVGVPDHTPKPDRRAEDAPRKWEDQDDGEGLEEDYFCPTFSGGEEEWIECVFPKVQREMMEYFQEVRRGGEEYVNPVLEAVKKVVREDAGGDGDAAADQGDTNGTTLTVKDVNRQGEVLPAGSAAVDKVTEPIKKVKLAADEVEVAGMAVANDLLEKAGLD